jgi:pimeloyl-ACP methyl ester carboxylesterase
MASQTPAPDWFLNAVATPYDDLAVEVLGCSIHYLRWGDPANPGVVLVHGGAAHAHWWSFIAPMLIRQYHVVALDMSGHGDSGRRDAYRNDIWAEEVLAVAEDAGMDRPVLVGHSMGGFVSIMAAATHSERLSGIVIVDSPVRRPDPESAEGTRGRAFRNPKTYPDASTAIEHFRLIPPQPCENKYIVDHVARNSLREVEGGVTWKFDPDVFRRAEPGVRHDFLSRVQARVAVFHGEHSAIVTPDVTDYMNEVLGRTAPFVEIPQAYHHLILDQPLAFVAALRAILADWEHSIPKRH